MNFICELVKYNNSNEESIVVPSGERDSYLGAELLLSFCKSITKATKRINNKNYGTQYNEIKILFKWKLDPYEEPWDGVKVWIDKEKFSAQAMIRVNTEKFYNLSMNAANFREGIKLQQEVLVQKISECICAISEKEKGDFLYQELIEDIKPNRTSENS